MHIARVSHNKSNLMFALHFHSVGMKWVSHFFLIHFSSDAATERFKRILDCIAFVMCIDESDSPFRRMDHKSDDKIENLTKTKTEINWKISRFTTKNSVRIHTLFYLFDVGVFRLCSFFIPFLFLSIMFSLHSFPFIRIQKKEDQNNEN